MSKRIVFCSDGTWQKASNHTNVYKLYTSLVTSADQSPIYDDGVGADGGPILELIGGAFGTGLWKKIQEGYTQICQVYEQGDELFLFGFSRGAYTARSLAGMIAACGLPAQDFSDEMVGLAFDAYRDRLNRPAKLQKLAPWKMFATDIKMVGVWDTVGSLGIPSAIGQIDPIVYGFLDTSLNPKIKNAFQALAMDERRAQFPPTLWTGPTNADQHVEQVWFTGAHSDCGGGQPDDVEGNKELSDVPLSWMMSKAIGLGLAVYPGYAARYAPPMDPSFALAKFHDGWSILHGLPIRRHIAPDSVIANSVVTRCQQDSDWRPSNLSFVNGALAPTYGVAQVVGAPAAAAAS